MTKYLDLEGLKKFKSCIDAKLDGKLDKVGDAATDLTVSGSLNAEEIRNAVMECDYFNGKEMVLESMDGYMCAITMTHKVPGDVLVINPEDGVRIFSTIFFLPATESTGSSLFISNLSEQSPNGIDMHTYIRGGVIEIFDEDNEGKHIETKIECNQITTPVIQVTGTDPSNKSNTWIAADGLTIIDGDGTGMVISKNVIEKRGAKQGELFAADGTLATPIPTDTIEALFG